ncbi:hypothetical protein CASFOL_041566 [Castilleja foliolosa]|uniref:Uncharacterized protein n=1 Tax=Castilleja foliolosa TaxID=1961234 RepID=A0ABD3BAT3_9LAMI
MQRMISHFSLAPPFNCRPSSDREVFSSLRCVGCDFNIHSCFPYRAAIWTHQRCMLTAEVKKGLSDVLVELVERHRKARASVTNECRLCIVDNNTKGGGTIDLEPCLTHSSTMEPTLAPVAVERTMTTRATASVFIL